MKTCLCLCLPLFFAVQCYGQETDKKFEKLYYSEKIEKYKGMKVGGIFFSVVGTIALGYYASIEHTEETISESMISGVTGMGCLALGIPTSIVGARSQNKYRNKLQTNSVSVQVKPQSSGLALTYRF
jgi:hypothetical protein